MASNNTSFYKKFARKYTLSSSAQKVLSTVLEGMIEETLEDARKLAQGTGKEKVAMEDVETAMVNLCQRLQSSSSSHIDDIQNEHELSSQEPLEQKHRDHEYDNRHRHKDLKSTGLSNSRKWKLFRTEINSPKSCVTRQCHVIDNVNFLSLKLCARFIVSHDRWNRSRKMSIGINFELVSIRSYL